MKKTAENQDDKTIDIKEHVAIAEPKEFFATIKGEKYKFRELSLSEKMRVLALLPDSFERFLRNFRIEQKDNAIVIAVVSDGVTLADISISSLITASSDALMYTLSRSFPDCKEDWELLPESETRDAITHAIILNGWGAFIQNFFITLQVARTPFMRPPSSQE
jgi:hypothetical protein